MIPCPVHIANDADCAALGEAVAGAGRECSDVVMFTLGSGVGGGIILNGEVFEGGVMGGAEVGHTVVRVNGRACTCGRKGCLEAYTSVPALLTAARQSIEREVTLKEIFEMYESGDVTMTEVVEQYAQILGTGIVNLVNLFRPQRVILGGEISAYADRITPIIEQMIKEDSFGGAHGMVPTVSKAQLGDNAGMIGAANL